VRRASGTESDVYGALIAIDGRLTLALLPQGRVIDLDKVAKGFGAREVELTDEDELQDVCSDSDGHEAHSPFGNFCGLPVVLEAELCAASHLTFKCDTDGDAIRVRLVDILTLLQPRVMGISIVTRVA
jgi:prolyl-tRNA editing enzyme YbaK/EbsC (Cys-tRNA(Pro) deacylase)